MTHQRTLTVAHWGAYEVEYDDAGKAIDLHPFSKDPDPSPIGLQMLSDEVARLRVRRPAVRKSWLQHGPGAFPERRGAEPFIEIPWDEALDLVADELRRVKGEYGNQAIFAGSYGWASAGRFHHAQSQGRRFFNSIGGFVRHENDYSIGAAHVLMPHIVGSMWELVNNHTSWDVLARECRLFVAFGGVPRKMRRLPRAAPSCTTSKKACSRCAPLACALSMSRQQPMISTPGAKSSGWRSAPIPTRQ